MNETSLLLTGIGTLAILLLLLAVQVVRLSRPRQEPSALATRLAQLEKQLAAQRQLLAQWQAVFTRLATRQTQLEQRQDSTDLRDDGEQAYRLAIKLARRGANASELADTCGLTRGEAELLSLLHQQRPMAVEPNGQARNLERTVSAAISS